MDDDFYDRLPHTLVLFEDAIGIFNHNNKYKKLYEMVFKNRYQRFTIFINVKEIYTIPPAIRKNLDSLWIFGGMSGKQSFVVLLKPFPMQQRSLISSGRIIKAYLQNKFYYSHMIKMVRV
jgi:hypothetical protein